MSIDNPIDKFKIIRSEVKRQIEVAKDVAMKDELFKELSMKNVQLISAYHRGCKEALERISSEMESGFHECCYDPYFVMDGGDLLYDEAYEPEDDDDLEYDWSDVEKQYWKFDEGHYIIVVNTETGSVYSMTRLFPMECKLEEPEDPEDPEVEVETSNEV